MNVFIYIILFLSALVNVTEVSTREGTPFGVPSRVGGDKRDRTADRLNAIQALSQPTQNYTPKQHCSRRKFLQEFFSLYVES